MPTSGTARVVIVTDVDEEDAWREFAYEQFLRDDAEDEAYDALA